MTLAFTPCFKAHETTTDLITCTDCAAIIDNMTPAIGSAIINTMDFVDLFTMEVNDVNLDDDTVQSGHVILTRESAESLRHQLNDLLGN